MMMTESQIALLLYKRDPLVVTTLGKGPNLDEYGLESYWIHQYLSELTEPTEEQAIDIVLSVFRAFFGDRMVPVSSREHFRETAQLILKGETCKLE